MIWVYYEDIERELVEFLTQRVGGSAIVATKKRPADHPDADADQVIITVAPAGDKTPVTRFVGVVLEIYASTYQQASNLSRMTEMYLRQAPEFTRSIKRVEIIAGPIRLPEDGVQEKRSISAELVVKGFED